MNELSSKVLKCVYFPPLWLMIVNWLGWGLGGIVAIIALILFTERIAIKENVFNKKNNIILVIFVVLMLIGLITSIYLHLAGLGRIGGLADC